MSVTEAALQQGGNDKAGPLIAGIGLISGEQQYTFELYRRVVLPLDGFVFWVKASTINPAWLGRYGLGTFDAGQYNGNAAVPPVLTPVQLAAYSFQVNASVHVSQDLNQDESETYVAQAILFTTKDQVEQFAAVGPNELYVTTLPTGARVAFSAQRNHYQLAGLWHYHGKAIYSTMATQLVDDPRTLPTSLQIVSNSLPYWLELSTPGVPVLPSFLTGLNIAPAYVSAHVYQTEALQQTPLYDRNTSQWQLVADRIRFTFYGLNNDAVLDWQTAMLTKSLDGGYGIMNMPVPVDEKKPQPEFQVIAQQKTMELQVNYYQNRARMLARQMIESAFITVTPA